MRIAVPLLAVILLGAAPPDLPVEQTKKNIKVLQGLPPRSSSRSWPSWPTPSA